MTATIDRWFPARSYIHRSADWWKQHTVRPLVALNGPTGTVQPGVSLVVLAKSKGLIVAPDNSPSSLMRVRPEQVEVKLNEGEKAKA